MMCDRYSIDVRLTEMLPLLREKNETARKNAWTEAIDLVLPNLLRFGRARCGDSEKLSDCVQETIRIVMDRVLNCSWNDLEALEELKLGYFAAVLSDQLRGHRPRKVNVEFCHGDEFDPADPTPVPDEIVERKEQQAIIHAALPELKPNHREVITLFDFEELPACEVAKLLTPDAVAENQRRIADVHVKMEALQARALRALSPANKAKLNELENRLVALEEEGQRQIQEFPKSIDPLIDAIHASATRTLSPKNKKKLNDLENGLFAQIKDGQRQIAELQKEIMSLHAEAILGLSPSDQENFTMLEKQLAALKRDGGCSAVCSLRRRAVKELGKIIERMLRSGEGQ